MARGSRCGSDGRLPHADRVLEAVTPHHVDSIARLGTCSTTPRLIITRRFVGANKITFEMAAHNRKSSQIRSFFILHALPFIILYRLTPSTLGVVKHNNYAVKFIMPSPLRVPSKLQPQLVMHS
jgi:hypothetical protein